MKDYNDVEHYRPKTSASRLPGCSLTHGYWWLAFTWENLLYACPNCNRSSKNDKFPLAVGSKSLTAEKPVPGQEMALLLDPGSSINPVSHIVFQLETVGPPGSKSQWWARPRNQSQIGNFSIDTYGLNYQQHLDMRDDHFKYVIEPRVKDFQKVFFGSKERKALMAAYERASELLNPANVYMAFNYDALSSLIPNSQLKRIKKTWPLPDEVGVY
ncbi:hypothetical protein KTQ42_22920 [Noviherbaspirillum sp. L7-7A]|uniref:hypothetical protein n=1 Tax=Noviherbaspirillum sp. L7-7A TaxID=2850560 RepID=UPI001C2CA0E8|nr:hypothetical protein [Noviherbaspirillum sp. L7-7A]MBV0882133.1 hypothetical protein [Noviherbaspirillum sp. L7-7A]